MGIRTEAIEMLTKALAGDAYAQAALAGMFRRPEYGLQRNPTEALRWAKKSADQKHPMGLYALAGIYWTGCGIAKDLVRAEELYAQCVEGVRKAAEAGDAQAQHNLGWMYEEGCGGLQTDNVKAVMWYRKGAIQGYARAQTQMGWMYQSGKGVERDIAEAVKWYREAAAQGDPYAQNSLQRIGIR